MENLKTVELNIYVPKKEDKNSRIEYYKKHLDAAIKWIIRSIRKGEGSNAYYGIWGKWSKPYPETTGYIIPTLISYSQMENKNHILEIAESLGNWLLEIQSKDGYWSAGINSKNNREKPSVFNTAQILKGMCALYLSTEDIVWLNAGYNGASWLADKVDESGVWNIGNYRKDFNPSYYTQVAWPMLEMWKLSRDDKIKIAAEKVLRRIINKQKENSVISGWGFENNKPAFTHTIAYTLRSLQESSRILNKYEVYEKQIYKSLDFFIRKAELGGGKIPGAFNEDLKPNTNFTCLTGNAQLAICFLNYYERLDDLRILNAAAKVIDYVCSTQKINHIIPGIRGGIAGSKPIWGRYMMLRYPNWAAKYHADSLMKLIIILQKHGL